MFQLQINNIYTTTHIIPLSRSDFCDDAGNLVAYDSDSDGIPDCEDEYPHVALDENILGFNLYPNPVDDFFVVEFSTSELTTVRVLNPLGQLVDYKMGTGVSKLTFDVADYSPGLYQVNILTDNQSLNQSILVK